LLTLILIRLSGVVSPIFRRVMDKTQGDAR